MGDKCEWKEGKFVGCESMGDRGQGLMVAGFNFCPFCGADIRKPEPEKPLIVRSGGTWVAHFEDVDYLYMTNNCNLQAELQWFYDHGKLTLQWKPFTEITLDDEIAKLRPMVCGGIQKYTLWGVLKEEGITWLLISDKLNDIEWYDNRLDDFRLATPKELQESIK